MTFILGAQRSTWPETAKRDWQRYVSYLEARREWLPRAAFELATSEWYYDPQDHRCPHDGWLETFTLAEPATGDRREVRTVSLTIRLLAAYHDGDIELHYPQVFAYDVRTGHGAAGHGDWLYDEFRLNDAGHVIHEIEWANGGRWVIVASDVDYHWLPEVQAAESYDGPE